MTGIVVGVDESESAAQALAWAAREAELRQWDLTAVMAWGWLDQHHLEADAEFDPSYDEKEALATLDAVVDRVLGSEVGATVERRVVDDLAPRALLEAASDADLLVVGARGLGGFRGLLVGSVSQHCLHHARCPIAVVRSLDGGRQGATGRIVVGVDGSDMARRALRWALEEGRLRQAAVTVVHAWQPPYVGGYPYTAAALDPILFEDGARELVDRALAEEDTSGLPQAVDRVLVCGGSASAVVHAAKGADLVVVGARGLGGFKGLLLGSVSTQVTHHAPCPVVVVPPEDRHG